jgi:DNA-binding NtrC family response regulator
MSAAEATLRVVTMRSRPCWKARQRAGVGELPGSFLRKMSTGPMIPVADLPGAISGAQSKVPSSAKGSSKIVPMAELEKQTILNAIAQLNGDKLLAARWLGIGKTTLYRKLKEYAVPQKAAIRSFSSFS